MKTITEETSFVDLANDLDLRRSGRRNPNFRGCPACRRQNAVRAKDGIVMIGLEQGIRAEDRRRLATRSLGLCERHALDLFRLLESVLNKAR